MSFGPELTVEAIIDAGPGGILARIQYKFTMPVESSVHGAQAPGPGEFCPKTRLQARSPSSQQWTVLRHPILVSFGPELTVEAIIDAGPGGILARIQYKFTMPVESSVHGAQAPGPGEFCPKTRLQARSPSSQQWTVLRHPILVSFGPELTVEAIIDAGPGGILARIQYKFTMPVESSVHGAQAPGPGEFCPKTRLQARSPSSQQWTVLRHPILVSFGPELTVEAIIDAGPGGILARIQYKFTMPVESSVHGAQAPGPGEFCPKTRLQARSPSSQQWTVLRHPILVSFGPELTVEAIIDAGPGGILARIQYKFTMPVETSVHGAQAPGPGEFCPKTRLQARSPSSQQWTVLRHPILVSFGPELTVEAIIDAGPGGILARIQYKFTMPVESSVHGAQAPGPGEFCPKTRLQARSPSSQQWTVLRHPILVSFGPELTVEAIIDAGPGGILARIQSKFTMPVESSVHGAQAPGPGEFCPKTRLQARGPSSQQWTVLRHPILASFGPELTVEAIIDAGPGGILARIQYKFTMPVESSVHGAQAPGPGEFCP